MSQFSWHPRSGGGTETAERPFQRRSQSVEAVNELKFTLHQRLIEELDPNKRVDTDLKPLLEGN